MEHMLATREHDPKEESASFRNRLRTLVDGAGGLTAFSQKTGIPVSSIKNYLTKSEPTRSVLSRILAGVKTDASWLVTGVPGEPTKKESSISGLLTEVVDILKSDPETVSKVARDLGISPAELCDPSSQFFTREGSVTQTLRLILSRSRMGGELNNGSLIRLPEFNFSEYEKHLERDYDFRAKGYRMKDFVKSCERKGSIAFNKSFFEKEFSSDPDSLLCYTMEDDSMFPEIPRGSLLLLDLERTSLQPNRTYLMRFLGNPIVRKVLEADSFQSWELLAGSKSDIKSIKQSVQKLAEANSVIALVTHVFKNCN